MLNCERATRLISESQERPLSKRERFGLKIHTVICSGCRNFEHRMVSIRQAMQSFASGEYEDHKTQDKKKKDTK
ncbi:hypothetical protein A9Q99_15580 [Gammaproteobacteria bacterium 45_16_T64]|nr:hypothetical protein A9Q99_15580 [Gammaproteobacteria bacterium 45_16_T64]